MLCILSLGRKYVSYGMSWVKLSSVVSSGDSSPLKHGGPLMRPDKSFTILKCPITVQYTSKKALFRTNIAFFIRDNIFLFLHSVHVEGPGKKRARSGVGGGGSRGLVT
jgi:hypothetical protein